MMAANPNFPQVGIVFRDLSTLGNPEIVPVMMKLAESKIGPDLLNEEFTIVGVESGTNVFFFFSFFLLTSC